MTKAANESSLSRYVIAFCSVVAGMAFASADIAIQEWLKPVDQVPNTGNRAGVDARVFSACVVFFGIAYSTGKLLYRCICQRSQGDVLEEWSRWHVAVLEVVGGSFLLVDEWNRPPRAFKLSSLVGVGLLGSAVYEVWRHRESWFRNDQKRGQFQDKREKQGA